MGLLTNPLYLLGPPLLFLVSFPLAFFAAVTTGMAVSLLAVRVSVVYFELGIALVHAHLFPEPAKPVPRRVLPASSPLRVRRTSSSSQAIAHAARLYTSSSSSSQHAVTPASSHHVVPAARLYTKSGSSASLINVNEMASARDFEGVGGWRFYEGEEEEAIWMGMNKRLELPLALPPGRRHQRRHTGEEKRWSWSPETLRMSPLQSRLRTPRRPSDPEEEEGDDYFPPQPVLRPLSTASEPLSMSVQHSRRASVVSLSRTSSSISSSSSASNRHTDMGLLA